MNTIKKKITLIGAGQIGGTLAHLLALKKLANIVLFDVAEGLAKGKALDIAQSSPVEKTDVNIIGTNNYEDTKNSDVIIITAGVPKNKVIGMAGILDSSRFIYFLSKELKTSVNNIKSLVLGGHGDSMVAMINHTEVNGKKLSEIVNSGNLSQEKLNKIIDRTKKGGAEIVKFLEKGSAFYAPASSGIEMAESYLKDLKKQLPCAAYLNGEYGVKDIYAGVPVIIGKNGVEKVIELELEKSEKENFLKSIDAVKELFMAAKKIDQNL